MHRPIDRRALLGLVAVGVMLATTGVSARGSSVELEHQRQPTAIELAQAFTAALNSHDVDALMALFTDDDAGPTLTAERFAWHRYEIRLWARDQIVLRVGAQAHDYRLTDHGAAWDADVYRDDWADLGLATVAVTNTIWVHGDRIADLTSKPRDPRVASLLLAVGTAHAAGVPVVAAQPMTTDPLSVVENFLLARDSADAEGAAGWCAMLLELQDVDGSWFIDPPTTTTWLRQLHARYVIDRLSPLAVDGDTVSWTERLAPRAIAWPEALRSSISIDVHVLVRDGKIAYLSGPYPPIPFRSAATDAGAYSGTMSGIPPAMLFVGSAIALPLTALCVAWCVSLIQRRRQVPPRVSTLVQHRGRRTMVQR
jgi:hypothetical protein